MAPDHTLDRQDELLIAVALGEFAREWESAEPLNAERAWFICRVICERHRLTPSEALVELEH